MKLKKAWVVFLLVLIICVQLVVLSSFHDVEANGLVTGNSVVVVAKWNYVQGSVHLSIMPIIQDNGTGHAELVLPNGTSIDLVSSFANSSPYSFTLQLPRTGDFFGNGGVNGTIALSQSQPLDATISQNVGNVNDYVDSISGITPSVDVYVFVVYGQAQVSVSGYGIGL